MWGQWGRFVIIINSGLIRWSSSVKCHSASTIRISLTWPSRFHMVNTRWALSQQWVQAIAKRPFVFFVLSWASGRRDGDGEVLWNSCTSGEAVYTSHTKEDAWLPTEAMAEAEIISSHIREAGKATLTYCGISLFVVSLHCVPRWSVIYASYGWEREARERLYLYWENRTVFFTRKNIVLSDSLHLWVLSGQYKVICSIIK